MVQIIAGEKGKGKTKFLLEKVNAAVQAANGNIVYLDKSQKHMYELSNKVRLVNVMDFPITNCSEFMGFICGIVSQDHDLEQMYFDSFLKIACLEEMDIEPTVKKLQAVSEKFGVQLILSVSLDEHELPESLKSNVLVAL